MEYYLAEFMHPDSFRDPVFVEFSEAMLCDIINRIRYSDVVLKTSVKYKQGSIQRCSAEMNVKHNILANLDSY